VDPKFDPPFLLIALLLSFCYLCSISQVKASKALLAFSVVSAVITQRVGVANSQRTEAPGAAQLTVTCTSHDRLTHRLELLNGTLYVTEVTTCHEHVHQRASNNLSRTPRVIEPLGSLNIVSAVKQPLSPLKYVYLKSRNGPAGALATTSATHNNTANQQSGTSRVTHYSCTLHARTQAPDNVLVPAEFVGRRRSQDAPCLGRRMRIARCGRRLRCIGQYRISTIVLPDAARQ
jgi:hypothetical protein